MQKSDFPCWLSPEDKAIAEALILEGFWYCGKAKDFIIYKEVMTRCHGWLIGGAYQEHMIDAVCDGALFVCDVGEDADFESEFLKIKLAIRKAVKEWNKPIEEQLRPL